MATSHRQTTINISRQFIKIVPSFLWVVGAYRQTRCNNLCYYSVLTSVQVESSRCRLGDWQTDSPLLGKKMIKPDPDLMSSLLNFSDEETDSGDDHDHQDGEQRLRSETGSSTIVENGDRKSSWRKQREYRSDSTMRREMGRVLVRNEHYDFISWAISPVCQLESGPSRKWKRLRKRLFTFHFSHCDARPSSLMIFSPVAASRDDTHDIDSKWSPVPLTSSSSFPFPACCTCPAWVTCNAIHSGT